MPDIVYYLPGRAGELHTGLGRGIIDRGFSVTGRETRGDFLRLTMDQQVEKIWRDLQKNFWSNESLLVAVSLGCYLFFHAQNNRRAFPGKVLLLSPVLGGAFSGTLPQGIRSQKAHELEESVISGRFPSLKNAEIHVGSEDNIGDPEAIKRFGAATSIPVSVAVGRGHMLGKDYVGSILDRWLYY